MTDRSREPAFHDLPLDLPAAPRVAATSPWDAGGGRSRATGFAVAIGALVVLGGIASVALPWWSKVSAAMKAQSGPPPTAEQIKRNIAECTRTNDLACLKENWAYFVSKHPDDGNAMANLGIVLNRLDDHAGAVVQFKRSIDAGEGTYDLFAYYADSLHHLKRDDEAIDWSYKALSVVPRLVDVRGSLAKLLVAQHRSYEALSLLESFDVDAVANGNPAYFEGQRIAIETSLAQSAEASASAASGSAAGAPAGLLRLPAFEHHFFAPVTGPDGIPVAFMVDTGATLTTVGPQWLAQAHVRYRVTKEQIVMRTADGRRTTAQQIAIDTLRVGPFELHDVPAVTCPQCVALLGQSALSHFDLQSSRHQGEEFLAMRPRRGA